MADSRVTSLTELSVVALDDVLYIVDTSDTTDDASGSSRRIPGNRAFGFFNHVCQGRLTLESGVAVSTSDQTAKTSLYLTPVGGNKVALYDGTRWKFYSFSEITLAIGTLTADKNYDVFLYDNTGTLTLELSAAWSSDSARTEALTTQDGVLVKSGATTRRLVGTIRTTTTTTTEDSLVKRFVWNAQNQISRPMRRLETTGTWVYTTDTWRQANASTANQLEFVCGAPTFAEAHIHARASSSNTSTTVMGAIGYDSTTTPAAVIDRAFGSGSNVIATIHCNHTVTAAAGYHYLAWLERSATGGTTTWSGVSGTIIQTGIMGSVAC